MTYIEIFALFELGFLCGVAVMALFSIHRDRS